MILTVAQLAELAEVARAAAREAGERIAGSRPRQIGDKDSGHTAASRVVTEVDRAAEACIVRRLRATMDRYDLGLLSEERGDDGSRLASHHFWCVDPLDGTLPFVEGRAGYAVSIALVARNGRPRLGVVFDPALGSLWSAVDGGGAERDGAPLHVPERGDRLTVFLDRSMRERDDYRAIETALADIAREGGLAGTDVRIGAGAVMNACGALLSPPACYFKLPRTEPGGGSLWDFAATACLYRELGCPATAFRGGALDLNRDSSLFMNESGVLLATDADLAAALRARLSQ